MNTRRCSRCKTRKPESEFWLANRATGKLDKRCKECAKASYRESRKRHLEEYRRRERDRYARRKQSLTPAQQEKQRCYARQYYQANRQVFLARTAAKDAARRFEKWLAGELRRHKHAGKMLLRPFFCPACGAGLNGTPAHLHHVRSYCFRDSLYVFPICPACHTELHRIQREQSVPILEATRLFLLLKRHHSERKSPKEIVPGEYNKDTGTGLREMNNA